MLATFKRCMPRLQGQYCSKILNTIFHKYASEKYVSGKYSAICADGMQ
jgi:hypothetical protein